MGIGASTSCFYPLETELALQNVLDLGYKNVEVFFNTVSELDDPFLDLLNQKKDDAGAKIVSVHPFSSSLENNCIFGEYERRFDDYIGLYQQHCYAAKKLGADILVIHGAYATLKRPLPEEHYFDRFAKLIEIGKREGVRVCQENVVRFRSQDVEFLKRMRDYLGDDFNMVFDVKQSIRSGYDPFYVAQEMKDSIVHIHLSDNSNEGDCLPPGKGTFDIKRLYDFMADNGYNGNYICELYSRGFDMMKELKESKAYLEKTIL